MHVAQPFGHDVPRAVVAHRQVLGGEAVPGDELVVVVAGGVDVAPGPGDVVRDEVVGAAGPLHHRLVAPRREQVVDHRAGLVHGGGVGRQLVGHAVLSWK